MTETTEKPNPSEGDLETPESPAPDTDPGTQGQGEDKTDWKALALGYKSKVEEANRVLAEQKERAQQSPAAERADAGTDSYWSKVAELADAGDPVAQAQLEIAQATLIRNQLDEIEDPTERTAVRKRLKDARGNVRAAHDSYRAEKLATENEALKKQLALANKNKPDPDVVRTEVREVTASEHKSRIMSEAEFDARQAQLKSEGNHRLAMKEQLDYDAGRIQLKG